MKYWLAGRTAPTGDGLLRIAANSPAVLAAFLSAIGRTDCLASLDVMRAREALKAALDCECSQRVAIRLTRHRSQPRSQDMASGAMGATDDSPLGCRLRKPIGAPQRRVKLLWRRRPRNQTSVARQIWLCGDATKRRVAIGAQRHVISL